MCGLCGIYPIQSRSQSFSSGRTASELSSLLQSLSHRGFYDGQYLDPKSHFGLGMVRLPIVDAANRMPLPFFNENHTLAMAVNGEIYNSEDLRSLLREHHVFITRTDVEVLLHLYEEMGLDFLRHLEGMFSIAIWDIPRQKLLLARDQAGIKPLFYALQEDAFYFSSEIRALKKICRKRTPDPAALYNYLGLQYIPQPATLFREIKALMPGEYLILEKEKIQRGTYWKPPRGRKVSAVAEDELISSLESKLKENVKRSLLSDQPVGTLLSGGVDSSLLTVMASQFYPKRLRTYSVSMDEKSFDESSFSRQVAQMAGSEHHEVRFTEDLFFDRLHEVIAAFDQPFAEGSFIPYFLICREAQKEVRVLLAGEGADELFGGYEIYRALLWKKLLDPIPKSIARFLGQGVSLLPVSHKKVSFDFKVKRFLEGLHVPEIYAHLFWRRAFSENQLQSLMSPEFLETVPSDEKIYPIAQKLWEEILALDPLDRHLYLDQKIPLVSDLLYRADMMSMIHTMETRVPFLQRDVIDFSFTIPAKLKWNLTRDKILLRRVALRYLPKKIAYKKKQGFNIPYAKWLMTPRGEELLNAYLLHNDRMKHVFDPEKIRQLVREHQSSKIDHGHALWSLLVLSIWNEKEEHALF